MNSGPAGQKTEATPIAATMTETMSSPKCGDINIFTMVKIVILLRTVRKSKCHGVSRDALVSVRDFGISCHLRSNLQPSTKELSTCTSSKYR